MEELSIEEKAKAYDVAIAKAKEQYNYPTMDSCHGLIEEIFPALKESEDEKLRKCTISLLKIARDKGFYDIPKAVNNCITWLEKQGEHKPILDVEIPFGAKDSELEEASYSIPNGYHAEIEDNKVVIKKGEQKPAEWSEEIEAAISLLKDIAEEQEKDYCPHNANDLRKAAIYLETCRSQSTLKPSDMQIEALESATENCAYSEYQDCLRELIEQLKKLKEG